MFLLLLSHAMKNGLFHPNCRHNARIYIEGVTRIPAQLDKDTVNKNYALEQQQRKLERDVRQAKRLEAGTLDPEKKKEYTSYRKRMEKQLVGFIDENSDVLRRDLWREKTPFAEKPIEENKPMGPENVKEFMTKQVLALPDEHKDVLQRYTGALATRINNGIKNNRINARLQKDIDLLDDALKEGIMPETVVLHRDTIFKWLDTGYDKQQLEEDASVIVGNIIKNPIFTSTSFDNLILPGRDTELLITVPKGYKGCQFLKPIAFDNFKNQEEVLFARGLSYKVKSAKIENNKIVLEVEVLPNE